VDLKYSKLQNKSKIRKFWKRINQEILENKSTPSKVDHQKPVLHPQFLLSCTSYHLNYTQPDHAMWQSSTFKIGQPEQATWQQSLH